MLLALLLLACEPAPLLPVVEQGRWVQVSAAPVAEPEPPLSGSATGAGIAAVSGEVIALAAGRDRQNQRHIAWILADRQEVFRVAGSGESWSPPERRALPEGQRPSAEGDGRVAVDADGKVFIAVLLDDGLAVFRWGDDAWERLGAAGDLGGPGRGHGATVVIDPQNHPVIGRRIGENVGVWRWSGEQWVVVGPIVDLPGVSEGDSLGGQPPAIGFDTHSEPIFALRLRQQVRWRKAENGAREPVTPQDYRYPVVVARHKGDGWSWVARPKGSPLQDDPRRRWPAARQDDSVGDFAWAEIGREAGTPAVAVDSLDRVLVAWTSVDRLLLHRFDGRRWSEVLAGAGGSDHPSEPRFQSTPLGLRLAWTDRGTSEGRRVRVLVEGEGGWTEPGPVDGAAGDSALPSFLVEPDGGLLGLWSERVAGAGVVYVRRLVAGVWEETQRGQGWTDLFSLSSQSRPAQQWGSSDRPELGYDSDGHLLFAWTELQRHGALLHSRRWDGAAWNGLRDLRRRSLWRGSMEPGLHDQTSFLLPTRGGGEVGLRLASQHNEGWTIGEPLQSAHEAALRVSATGEATVVAHREGTVGLYRWTGGLWSPLGGGIPAGESRVEPALEADITGSLYTLWVDDTAGEAELGRAEKSGLLRIPGLMAACEVDEQADIEDVELLSTGDGMVAGLAVIEGDGRTRYPFCRWSGSAWETLPALEPSGTTLSGRPGGGGALSLAADGQQIFAAFELDTSAGRRVAVQRLRSEGWTPMAGGGPKGEVEPCRGACFAPDLVARSGELCLTWITGGERADIVELRCHRIW